MFYYKNFHVLLLLLLLLLLHGCRLILAGTVLFLVFLGLRLLLLYFLN